jgi:hypothetical protein
MLRRMSIGEWFRNLFSGSPRVRTDGEPSATTTEEYQAVASEEKGLDEARIDAGGGGALGITGDPSSHASPGEEIAEAEADAE